jgi:anti-sigma regulatory factor (Ser/Thr protein kinase)
VHEFVIEADPTQIARLRSEVRVLLDHHGVADSLKLDTMIVVSELASNAVEAAETGSVEVSIKFSDGVVISVSNQGHWLADPDGFELPPPSRSRGRGLAIARQASDRMSITSAQGRTVVVVHIPAPDHEEHHP